MRTMSMRVIVGLLATSSLSTAALTQERHLAIGAGVSYGPVFNGSTEYDVDPEPYIDARWGRYFINDIGVGADIVSEWGANELTVGVAVFAGEGREEADDIRLRGLGDIDTAIEAKLFAEAEFGPLEVEMVVAKDLGSGHEGTYLDISGTVEWELSRRFSIEVGPEVRIADGSYTRAFYGISPEQAARSGLPAFRASAGVVSGEMTVDLTYALSDHWSVVGEVGVGMLFGDASNSPVSQDDTYSSAGIGLVYRF